MDKLIGKKIRKVREIKNFSQEYVANKLSISQSAYSNIENGKTLISEKSLNSIAKILEVTPEIIQGYNDQVIFNSCIQSGYVNTNNINNPIDKIESLYEEIIKQLKERIHILDEIIKLKNNT
ncbi:MAG TPA: helix-turn-helix transcriptional regulator [Taishania sp.]|nr:helix-turn-helix transcriptional regulator [Taishania sp.]